MILDLGVQDTGPDGAAWALALRGVDVSSLGTEDLVLAWTVRGAPHLYRRRELPSVAAAVAPFADADAGRRIYDAAKPLKAAGIGNLEALDALAGAMRSIVTEPTVKGEVSSRLTAVMEPPYLRWCRPCNATHPFEMPFRLAALRAGLELEAGTSPPVLRPIPRFRPAARPQPQHDVIRAYLRLLGPATPKQVAGYLDAPVADVTARWPEDAVEVLVETPTRPQARSLLADDLSAVDGSSSGVVHLLPPFDLFLQARDREVLVGDATRAKELWPVLGRPGAVLRQDEIVGTWRPRTSGRKLTVTVRLWGRMGRPARQQVTQQAERLAVHRRLNLSAVDFGGD